MNGLLETESEKVINKIKFDEIRSEVYGKIDCILSGAGVSMPSGCPDANVLKGYLWDMLCNTFEESNIKDMLCKLRSEIAPISDKDWVESYFRMEQLVDLLYLSDERNKKKFHYAFHGAYEILCCGYMPNKSHWYIMHAANVSHLLTLNMDLLLEKARAKEDTRQIVHLHGTADNRKSIITTPSEYIEGLPKELRAKFREAVDGKTVLVVGYSGRDCDVMPLFSRYPPGRIIWIQFSVDYSTKPIALEVENLKSLLNAKMSGTFEVIYGDTTSFLKSLSNTPFEAMSLR